MIISRTPLRVSFVGGGSDLPSYYSKNHGRVLSMAINKYVYVSVNKSVSENVRVAYSKVEECREFAQVAHPLVRNSAELLGVTGGYEITSTADIPGTGTGLGSSSSFTVGLLNALNTYRGQVLTKEKLANLACHVEINMCDEPIGKQDQYAAAMGGMNTFEFFSDQSVKTQKLEIDQLYEHLFLSSILVFYTGTTRSAASILREQNADTLAGKKDKILSQMAELVEPFGVALRDGDFSSCGQLLDLNWQLKRQLSSNISNSNIDEIYNEGLAAGALGGKLLGAGAGGFILFIAPQSKHTEIARRLNKLTQQFWSIDKTGSSIIYKS